MEHKENSSGKHISYKLNEFFQQHLPLTQFMELKVDAYDGDELILVAPLGPNINDKQTAFGGSLYNAAVMACWGFAYLKTQEADIECNQVVIHGDIDYLVPVTGSIRVVCKTPGDEIIDQFLETYRRKGRARIELNAAITSDGEALNATNKTAVSFTGQYAILKE